jgi:hypothetical protein
VLPAAQDLDGRGKRMHLHPAAPPPTHTADRLMCSTRAQDAANEHPPIFDKSELRAWRIE